MINLGALQTIEPITVQPSEQQGEVLMFRTSQPFVIKWRSNKRAICTKHILNLEVGSEKLGKKMTLGEFLHELFPEGNESGYVAVSTKEKGILSQTMVDVESIYKYIDIKKDCYVSMNTFFIPQRRAIRSRHIHSFWLDIDYYKTEYTKEEVIARVKWLIDHEEMPPPTFILHSGRGVYLIWKFKDVPGRFVKVRKFHRAVQDYLYNLLKEYGADPKALDVARILRIPGSKNTKVEDPTQATVLVDEHNENAYYLMEDFKDFIGVEYELAVNFPEKKRQYRKNDKKNRAENKKAEERARERWYKTGEELQRMYDENAEKWAKEKERKAKERKAIPHKAKKVARMRNFHTLHHARANDIETLVNLRKGKEMKGYRSFILHVYHYWMLLAYDKTIAYGKVTKLNNKIHDKLTKEELDNAISGNFTAAKERSEQVFLPKKVAITNENGEVEYVIKGYNYSNQRLCDILQISEVEQRSMSTIMEKKEKYRRRNQARRPKDEEGLTPKQREMKEFRALVLKLKEEGHTQKEVAELTGKSLKTIKRNWKPVEQEKTSKPLSA